MPSSEEQFESFLREALAGEGKQVEAVQIVESGRDRLHATIVIEGQDRPEYASASRLDYPDTDS